MLVSVIIPVHNAELYLERCLNSVLAQTYKNIEVIIVNDASSDKSQIIIEKYEKIDPRIKVFTHSTNLGAFFARKTGADLAKGRYYVACDADDELLSDFIEKAVAILKKQDVDILDFGRAKVKGEKIPHLLYSLCTRFSFPNNYFIQGRDVFDNFFLKEKIRTTIWGKFFRTEFIRQYFPAECPDTSADDFFIMIHLTFYAKSYLYIRDCGYIYHYGCGHWGKKKPTEEQMRRLAQIYLLFDLLESFFKKEQVAKVYFEKLDIKRKDTLKGILRMILQEYSDEVSVKFIHILLEVWGNSCFVEILYESIGKELSEIKNSLPWKITYPMRAVYDLIFLKLFNQDRASLKALISRINKRFGVL